MVTSLVQEEVHYPDGRITLASNDEIEASGYANGDLAPLPIARRTWTTYNDAALWVGMSRALANLIVLVPMLLNSHAGTKYDFSNLLPKLVSFRTGGIITGVIGILIQPWRLLANPHAYIFVWLGFYGGLLGAVAGVLIADYWLIRRTELRLADLYRRDGAYWYNGGWNWRAVVALGVGALLAVGGAWSAPGEGPFPAGGLIPALKPLYNYNWVVGFGVALVLYYALTMVSAQREPARHAAQVAG